MKALINVDLTKDFMPVTEEDYKNKLGGALAVKDGDEVVPIVNKLSTSDEYDIVVFTYEWHPHNHKSFASQHSGKNPFDRIMFNGVEDTLWPDHCVQNTEGAKFHDALNVDLPNAILIRKGEDKNIHPYSGFGILPNHSTGLLELLKEKGVTEVHITGLASDFCVLDTALDAAKYFKTVVFKNATRGIADDLEPTWQKMIDAGIILMNCDE